MFYIQCTVSGGVTGYRTGRLKQDGKVAYFNTREDAETLCKNMREKMGRYSAAVFSYTVEEE